MVELIKKKRDGFEMSVDDINTIITGFLSGQIPDYQISAWLMAVYFNGMTDEETAALTQAMIHSGDVVDLSSIDGIKVDKHSTGGVGDKTTLIVGPLVAAAGVYVAKMSGRGLGHTGGTLDKLEAIPGFRVDLSADEFLSNVKNHHIAICSQNKQLVPADKKLYALRDVTGTVDNISLIASSIMSKKLACGADAIVIDLKLGDGAFIKTMEDADKLAKMMISTAQKMHKKIVVVVTGMDAPLGNAIGNALEVKEAIETLKGHGPDDLTTLCLDLASQMLNVANKTKDVDEARVWLKNLINNGGAVEKLKELIRTQGGNEACVDDASVFSISKYKMLYLSQSEGYISRINATDIGLASVKLGAGRETKESAIDYGAGIMLIKKPGDKVEIGDTIAELYANDETFFSSATSYLDKAYTFSKNKPELPPIILKVITN